MACDEGWISNQSCSVMCHVQARTGAPNCSAAETYRLSSTSPTRCLCAWCTAGMTYTPQASIVRLKSAASCALKQNVIAILRRLTCSCMMVDCKWMN